MFSWLFWAHFRRIGHTRRTRLSLGVLGVFPGVIGKIQKEAEGNGMMLKLVSKVGWKVDLCFFGEGVMPEGVVQNCWLGWSTWVFAPFSAI